MLTPLSAEALDDAGLGYPRPQLRRDGWLSLNGPWQFALDPLHANSHPRDVEWTHEIRVPFSPETSASGIANLGFYRACWYRRQCELPPADEGDRWLLHFGAVDYRATVWVNGFIVGTHEGGYTPFTFDITEAAGPLGCEVVVCAEDDPHDLAKPRGKQDWLLEPHSIWYPRTTGIWQTVWLERVPSTWIGRLAFTPDLSRWEIGIESWLEGARRESVRLDVKLRSGSALLAADTYLVVNGEVHRRIALSDPGIDDSRNELLWHPHMPRLIDVTLTLWGDRQQKLDEVRSYVALRSIGIEGNRFVLNGRPYFLRMVLDQGYWPESGLTAPNDEALRRDVALVKEMGFNGARKHQKIEDPRYLYWADTLGLAVWEEMPSAYRFTQSSVQRLSREWASVIARDYSHPCIVSWVPINESWGVPNLPNNAPERHYVQALYHLTKTLDPTRPVIGNDGWESVATDIIGIHDYDDSPARLARRYRANVELPRLFKRERPGGRLLVLGSEHQLDLPLMLTEFGGISLAPASRGTWGYVLVESAEDFARLYEKLLRVVNDLGVLSGFCYTQFADTYQETNGLVYADRTPKFPLARIAKATAGRRDIRSEPLHQIEGALQAGARE